MEEKIFENRIDLSEIKEIAQKLREEISKIIVGQADMIEHLLVAILTDGHVLLEGVPGIAKTLTAKLLARTIDAKYSRIQFTPDLMPSDILGTSIFNLESKSFEFKKGPIFANIILIDEINRAPAKTQAALFEIMEEKQVTMDGQEYQMSLPFMVIATQNPIEQEGTYKLPEAQLDRFLFKINIDYPKLDEEVDILKRYNKDKNLNETVKIEPFLKADKIKEYRQLIAHIHIETQLLNYIAEIIQKTRKSNALYLGASPRASLAIMNCSKAYASIQGRDFVTPEDIKIMAYPVLNHRLILTAEKEMEGTSMKQVIERIIDSVEVPR